MTDLNDLRLIAAIAETATLAGAARRLAVSHATVFRRLENIEAGLGVRLFERRAGRYVATAAGEELADVGAEIDRLATRSLLKVVGHDLRPSGLVRITTTESIAICCLGPILASCRRLHPQISIQLFTSNDMQSLSKRDADIAIRPTHRPPEELIGKRIGGLAMAAYASRAYLANHGESQGLAEHDWLALDDSMSQHRSLKWLSRMVSLESLPFRANTFPVLRQACAEGLGVALMPCFVGDTHAALQRVTGPLEGLDSELWLLTHPDLRDTARIKLVYQFLQQQLAGLAPLFAGDVPNGSHGE
ncbi:LysR family transcriptional regulator [Chitinimonas arctica]|nr:LysR family transcriptional regulator [Chitinimonas arctica]